MGGKTFEGDIMGLRRHTLTFSYLSLPSETDSYFVIHISDSKPLNGVAGTAFAKPQVIRLLVNTFSSTMPRRGFP